MNWIKLIRKVTPARGYYRFALSDDRIVICPVWMVLENPDLWPVIEEYQTK